jgi:ABC-type multidrug transport system permease subunit
MTPGESPTTQWTISRVRTIYFVGALILITQTMELIKYRHRYDYWLFWSSLVLIVAATLLLIRATILYRRLKREQ